MFTIEIGEDNPILRTVCDEVKSSEWKQYQKLGKDMLKYVKNPKNGGIGLAAPQIGVTKRIIVVGLPVSWDDENYKIVLMYNPVITEHSQEMIDSIEEGCLSLPKSKQGYVNRHRDIKVEYLDEKMKTKALRLTGVASVVVQHEVDHLNGELYTDKLVK